MQNRRDCFRHVFEDGERPPVELRGPGAAGTAGEIVNLSLTGMEVAFPPGAAAPPDATGLRAEFADPGTGEAFAFDCAVVHRREVGDARVRGYKFLPLADALAERGREQALWRFLLAQQRRALRKRRGGPPAG